MDKIRMVVLISLFVIMPILISVSYAQDKPPYYVGMTQEELFKIYPQKYQINYVQKYNAQVYTFDDYLTDNPGDSIMFCLKDGKVAWWDKDKANPTPEERLKEITDRSKRIQPATPGIDTGAQTEAEWKQWDRIQSTNRTNTERYNKEKYGIGR